MISLKDILDRHQRNYSYVDQPKSSSKLSMPMSIQDVQDQGNISDTLLEYSAHDAFVLEQLSEANIRIDLVRLSLARKTSVILTNIKLPATASKTKIETICFMNNDYTKLRAQECDIQADIHKLQGLHGALTGTINALRSVLSNKTAEMRLGS